MMWEIPGTLYAVDILLAETLAEGETATLEYQTKFCYQDPPDPEFRRVAVVSLENLDIRVQFHSDKLPRQVSWAVWDGLNGRIVEREPATLDSQFAVHRYLRFAQQTVAGFRWEW
jgi:hypothetical protein